jgi:hypothetical protein
MDWERVNLRLTDSMVVAFCPSCGTYYLRYSRLGGRVFRTDDGCEECRPGADHDPAGLTDPAVARTPAPLPEPRLSAGRVQRAAIAAEVSEPPEPSVQIESATDRRRPPRVSHLALRRSLPGPVPPGIRLVYPDDRRSGGARQPGHGEGRSGTWSLWECRTGRSASTPTQRPVARAGVAPPDPEPEWCGPWRRIPTPAPHEYVAPLSCTILAAIADALDGARAWIGRVAGRTVEIVLVGTGLPPGLAGFIGRLADESVRSLLKQIGSLANALRLVGVAVCCAEELPVGDCPCVRNLVASFERQAFVGAGASLIDEAIDAGLTFADVTSERTLDSPTDRRITGVPVAALRRYVEDRAAAPPKPLPPVETTKIESPEDERRRTFGFPPHDPQTPRTPPGLGFSD